MEVDTMLLPHMSLPDEELDLGIVGAKVLATDEGVLPREPVWFWALPLPPPARVCMIWLASFSVVMVA